MPTGFPPQPVYPHGIDSDYTLYLVYNTSEANLAANNEPWAAEVPVIPRKLGQTEIWSDNGFATISGEMFYYDGVDKNSDGYIYNLKKCIRNLGGTHTQPNQAGTVVRGFIMAEHHNQLVDVILRVEDFVGENFSPDETTLDFRIRQLQPTTTPVLFDDFDCPDIQFTFDIVSNDPAGGLLADYFIQITGNYGNFTLDFGDGTSTNSPAAGSHQYAPNATVDPVITINNTKCQIVQTPIQRTATSTPSTPPQDPILDIPILLCPDIGDIIIPDISVPVPDIIEPPLILPCVDITPFSFPSTFFAPISIAIDFAPINIPSEIVFVGISIPDVIVAVGLSNISLIVPTIGPINVNIPSIPSITITVDGTSIPSTITVNNSGPGSIPSIISVASMAPLPCISFCGDTPTFPCITFCDPPTIPVNWGEAPTVPINVTVTCNCQCCPSSASMNFTEPDFVDQFNPFQPAKGWSAAQPEEMEINYDFQGFPSLISFVPPVLPDLKVVHELPSTIELIAGDSMLIEYVGPTQFELIAPAEPMRLVFDGPSIFKLDTSSIGEGLKLIAPERMPKIEFDTSNIPSAIQVIGIPSVIGVIGMPSTITVIPPAEPMTVQMLPPTEAIPISVMVTLTVDGIQKMLADQGQQLQCVTILPCPR